MRDRRRPFWYLRRRRRGVASEIDEELSVHIEMRAEELAGGLPRGGAREAIRQFGDLKDAHVLPRQDRAKEARMHRG